jgi:hypothetical protein
MGRLSAVQTHTIKSVLENKLDEPPVVPEETGDAAPQLHFCMRRDPADTMVTDNGSVK